MKWGRGDGGVWSKATAAGGRARQISDEKNTRREQKMLPCPRAKNSRVNSNVFLRFERGVETIVEGPLQHINGLKVKDGNSEYG